MAKFKSEYGKMGVWEGIELKKSVKGQNTKGAIEKGLRGLAFFPNSLAGKLSFTFNSHRSHTLSKAFADRHCVSLLS